MQETNGPNLSALHQMILKLLQDAPEGMSIYEEL